MTLAESAGFRYSDRNSSKQEKQDAAAENERLCLLEDGGS